MRGARTASARGPSGNAKTANHPPRSATKLFPSTFYTRLPVPPLLNEEERSIVKQRLSLRAMEQASPWYSAGLEGATFVESRTEFDEIWTPSHLRATTYAALQRGRGKKRSRELGAGAASPLGSTTRRVRRSQSGERDHVSLSKDLEGDDPSAEMDDDADGEPQTLDRSAAAADSAPAADDLYDHEDNSDGSDPDGLDYAAAHNDDDELYGDEDHLGGAVGEE